MKIFKIVTCFVLMVLVAYLLESFLASIATDGLILGVLTGGPFRDLKWRGFTFRPTNDGEAEFELSGTDYEKNASPNGDGYSTGTARIGFVQQECAMDAGEYVEFKKLQDGTDGAGTATAQNGDVLSINGSLDGEQVLSGGKITVKIAGKVNLQ